MIRATATCHSDRRRAIGYLRTDISGDHQPRHIDAIRLLARRQGHTLIYIVRLRHDSVPYPVGHLLEIVRATATTTLIVPDLAHVDDRPGPVCDVCDLITVCPEQLWMKSRADASGNTTEPTRLPEDWHSEPDGRLPLTEAHRTMQVHLTCNPLDCPRKAAAFTRLVEAGELVPASRSPRQRAAARGIPYPPAGPAISRTSPPIDILHRLFAALDQA
ncbi:hypothetical protein [Nocardia fusca]|uniref:hypothetical protein n=1 Tax=Nocardia fusca TaxID=941183 RepID=UPI0007A74D90|nr:hypothetical protein [Nocardia fusca]